MYFRFSLRHNPAKGKSDLRKASAIPTFARSVQSGSVLRHWISLQLAGYLRYIGFSEEDTQLAITQIISRAVYPASELETARWIRENSAVCELTDYPLKKITKDKLYRSSLKLF